MVFNLFITTFFFSILCFLTHFVWNLHSYFAVDSFLRYHLHRQYNRTKPHIHIHSAEHNISLCLIHFESRIQHDLWIYRLYTYAYVLNSSMVDKKETPNSKESWEKTETKWITKRATKFSESKQAIEQVFAKKNKISTCNSLGCMDAVQHISISKSLNVFLLAVSLSPISKIELN